MLTFFEECDESNNVKRKNSVWRLLIWCLSLFDSAVLFGVSTTQDAQVLLSIPLHWERMTLVSSGDFTMVASLIIDLRFSISQNLWSRQFNKRKRCWKGLHVVVRVYRNYFELKVSLLNGKEAYLLKHHMLCYHWTDYYTILVNWDTPDSLMDRSSLLDRCPLPGTELSNLSMGR